MKKILLTIYMILFTSACVSNSNNPDNNINNIPENTIDKIYLNKNIVYPNVEGIVDINIIKIEYNNHQYLYFMPHVGFKNASIIHDPDCPCNKNKSM